MNFQIRAKETNSSDWNDITNKVISYTRNHNLCDASGILELTLVADTNLQEFVPYTTLEVYEDGTLKGTYFVSTKNLDKPAHTIMIASETSTRRLADYWISESLYTTTPTTTTRYWIEYILNLTGVSYSINTSSQGEYVQKDSEMGYTDAKSSLVRLLQQSGWYMTFSDDGTIQIGKISVDGDPSFTLSDYEILELEVTDSDKMYRNRAVVWGKANPITKRWIFSDQSVSTSLDYDSGDKRTVVYANHLISEQATADTVAKRLLDNFASMDEVTKVSVAGFLNVNLAEKVMVNSEYHNKKGMVTEIQVNVDSNGAFTTLVLDQRCPRIIGAFDPGGWVYIGTTEDGVWRKPLQYTHTWSDYSQGLLDLNIKDLSIANGIFATVAGEALYYRYEGTGSWNKVTMNSLPTISGTLPFSSGVAVACSVNQDNSMINGLYNLSNSYYYYNGFLTMSGEAKSWLYQRTNGGASNLVPIQISGNYGYVGVDVEAYGINGAIITAITSGVVVDYYKESINSSIAPKLSPNTFTHLEAFSSTTKDIESSFTDYYLFKDDFIYQVLPNTGQVKRRDTKNNTTITRTLSTLPLYASELLTVYSIYDSETLIIAYVITGNKIRIIKFNIVTNTETELYLGSSYSYIPQNLDIVVNNGYLFVGYIQNTTSPTVANAYYIYGSITGTLTNQVLQSLSDYSTGTIYASISFVSIDTTHVVGCVNNPKSTGPGDNPTGGGYSYPFYISITSGSLATNSVELATRNYLNSVQVCTNSHEFYFVISSTSSYAPRVYRVRQNLSIEYVTDFIDLGGVVPISSKVYAYMAYQDGSTWKLYDLDNEEIAYTFGNYTYGTQFQVSVLGDDEDGGIYYWLSSTDIAYKWKRDNTVTNLTTLDDVTFSYFLVADTVIFCNSGGSVYIYTDPNQVSRDITLSYPSDILYYDGSNFTKVNTGFNDNKIEISKPNTSILYGGADYTISGVASGIYNFGFLSLSDSIDTGYLVDVSLIGRNPNFNYPITDARSFDLATASGVSRCIAICQPNTISGFTALGLIDTNYVINGRATYVTESGILVYSGIQVQENYPFQYIDLSRWYSFSGIVTNFETSNYHDVPYMFVGIKTALGGVDFYQKDAYSKGDLDGGFIQRIDSIPNSNITIIRVDDEI